jgi:1-aminocyclopropane-1-carboxylate deaminase
MKEFIHNEGSIEQAFCLEVFGLGDVHVCVKRDDLLHPIVSGNKWRKLKYNAQQALQTKHSGIFTFGGAFSNHLVATAAACQEVGLASIGFVRGDELNEASNATLKKCSELGMKLIFLSRELYFMRNDKQFIDELRMEHPGFFPVPEGGANYYGIIGCQEIWQELNTSYDHVFVACGTGTTAAGLILGKPAHTQLHIVPALKGFETEKTIRSLVHWSVFDEEMTDELMQGVHFLEDYHFGGYGKVTPELLDFQQEILQKLNLPLDQVYTAKAFYALLQTCKQEVFTGKRVLFIHTGGLQGNTR